MGRFEPLTNHRLIVITERVHTTAYILPAAFLPTVFRILLHTDPPVLTQGFAVSSAPQWHRCTCTAVLLATFKTPPSMCVAAQQLLNYRSTCPKGTACPAKENSRCCCNAALSCHQEQQHKPVKKGSCHGILHSLPLHKAHTLMPASSALPLQ